MAKHIEHIEIKNFKSIRQAEIKDCRRINVFIGYPNVGKSNLLEAIGLLGYLQPRIESTDLRTLVRLDSFVELFFDGSVNEEAGIKCNEGEILPKYENEYRLVVRVFKKKTNGDFEEDKLAKLEVEKDKTQSDAYRRIDYDSRVVSPLEVYKYDFKASDFKQKGNAKFLYVPYGQNLFEVIEHNGELRKSVLDLFATYRLKLLFDKASSDMKVIKEFADGSYFPIPFHQVADTLQRLIFHKAAIATNKDSVLLFEEPEAHMFPPYISRLTADMIYDENNNQYFLTTHSPFVLNDLLEDAAKEDIAIYAVGYKNETGETTIRKISDEDLTNIYQYGVDLFFNLENYLKDEA